MSLHRPLLACFVAACLGAQTSPEALRTAAERLRAEALRTHGAYEDLTWLCDRIGHRLSGSPQLDQAIAWAQARLKAAGLVNVHAEPVLVPHWVRGHESADLLLPTPHHLHLLRYLLLPLRLVLRRQQWFGGAAPSYADHIIAGTLMWPRCASRFELLDANDPLAQWLERVLDLYGGLGRSATRA